VLSLLTVLQHADTAFPSGAFAFSNGLEGVSTLGRKIDRDALQDLVGSVLLHRWTPFDRIALARSHRAGTDLDTLIAVDREVEIANVVEPLRTGSRRNAGALLAAHVRIGTPGAERLLGAIRSGGLVGHLTTVQGYLWRETGIAEGEALGISAYQTAGGLVAAAVRLGQLGAIDAQKVLAAVIPLAAEAAARSVEDWERLSSATPFMDIAVMRHARADLKLFAN
jgi:urease accessory protein